VVSGAEGANVIHRTACALGFRAKEVSGEDKVDMVIDSAGFLFALLFGLAIGSFLNVCIYRIPLKKSIINPPSSCPQCGERIRIYDNIPLLSYIVLLGRCRSCRHPIPIRYPLVEAITGLVSAALFMRFHLSPEYFLFFGFAAALLVIAFIDLDHKIIPDILSIPALIIGFAATLLKLGVIPWTESLVGIIGGGGFLYLVATFFEKLRGHQGMGGGDVKMLAMIGAWVGWRALPLIILISSLAGILIGGGSLLLAQKGMRTRIPFGPFLALGALVWLFFSHDLQGWLFRLGR
jgi:leader peptidase (prepilin peptidase)/N-methyltransferase